MKLKYLRQNRILPQCHLNVAMFVISPLDLKELWQSTWKLTMIRSQSTEPSAYINFFDNAFMNLLYYYRSFLNIIYYLESSTYEDYVLLFDNVICTLIAACYLENHELVAIEAG